MADQNSDHEALIALRERVQQHQESLIKLDAHDRDNLVTLTRLNEHIAGLQSSHREIRDALQGMKQQQQDDREHTAQQFRGLDDKISAGNIDLRDHFDEKIDGWREEIKNTLQAERDALPQWAKVRLMKWSIAVAVVAVVISVLEFLRVL